MTQQPRLHYPQPGRFSSYSSKPYSAISTKATQATQQADAALPLDVSWGCDFLGFPDNQRPAQFQPGPYDDLAL
ncbi:hypothetical protein [Hymenobacter wooponensis]|uniref:Uncharacterized protein n=1 Tax=Hymenobacter wooponensis TaxID=1525360 RepID=A0A4Z0MGB7_9BACT|nr:hypothetical protein [Hymenobacter wooponensis]TGD78783.1 hypothetical protein EU557_17530 [Hymenobacter wooponensis]